MQISRKGLGITLCLLAFTSITQAQSPVEPRNKTPDSSTITISGVSSSYIPRIRTGIDEKKILRLSLQEAISMMLENNLDIRIERRNIEKAQNDLLASLGAYAIRLNTNFQYDQNKQPISSTFNQSTNRIDNPPFVSTNNYIFNGGFSRLFTYGGSFEFSFDNNRLHTNELFTRLSQEYRSSLRVSYRQPLLRNFRINEEEKTRKARKKQLDISDLEFRQKLVNLVAQVQAAYYDLVFAIKNEEIYQEAVELAQTQLEKNKVQVEAGEIAPIELVSAKSQLEMRKSQAASANLAITQAENQLKKLVLGDPLDSLWFYSFLPTDNINFSSTTIDLDKTIDTALEERMELKELNAQSDINKVDVAFRKNQLKPKVDVFGTLLLQGLIGTRNVDNAQLSTTFNLDVRILGNYFEGLVNMFKFRTYTTGAVFSYSLGNEIARANRDNSLIVGQQVDEEKKLQMQNIIAEVRNAVQTLESSSQRVKATHAAVNAAEEQLIAEQVRYDSGLSTNFLVFSCQNFLSFVRGREVRALLDYQKAQVELQRVVGNNIKGLLKD